MFEQAFKNIDDVLWKEAGCTTELDYTEQTSWLLFLKYLDDLEREKETEAKLDGKKYTYILEKQYRWESWAAPKDKDGRLDHNRAMTGDDLREFVDRKLFPYLKGFTARASGPKTIEYKIGQIFAEIENKVRSGYNLREIIDHIDELRFRSLDRSPVFYPDCFAKEYERYLLREGDLIMSLTGTTGKEDYGYVVRIPESQHNLLMNQRIAKFELLDHSRMDSGFFFYYLRSRVFLDMLYPTANGTRQANLSSVTMKTLPVPICSLKKQQAVAAALAEVRQEAERLCDIYERKLIALEELKKSLLHRAFTGKL